MKPNIFFLAFVSFAGIPVTVSLIIFAALWLHNPDSGGMMSGTLITLGLFALVIHRAYREANPR